MVAYLRSSDGTAVSATLDYLDCLLAYDYCAIDSRGPGGRRSWWRTGAEPVGRGWLPMQTPTAAILDGSDIQTKPANIRGC